MREFVKILGTCLPAAAILLSVPAAAQRARDHPLAAAERALGTNTELDWGFHRVVEDPQGLGLKFPGYLIGVEKAERRVIRVADRAPEARVPLDYAPSLFNGEERGVLRRILNDGERTFVSHVVTYERRDSPVPYIRPAFLHNAYARTGTAGIRFGWNRAGAPGEFPLYDPARTPYDDSFAALDKLGQSLRQRLEGARAAGKPVSHVFVASMGWNTPQEEAIRNYNSLFGNLFEAAQAAGGGPLADPVVIGFSWPSEWSRLRPASYFTKADDADEIGFVWANYLLQRVLFPLKEQYGFRIVTVGHSFGARLTTRAVFSAPVLGMPHSTQKVDLVVALQGAFSANRFLAERGVGQEGAPYAQYRERARQVVLTWSPFDSANPLANITTGANNVGGRPGYTRAAEYPAHFQLARWRSSGSWLPQATDRTGKILMVDASELVRHGTHGSGGVAHSDIFHPAVGQFLLDVVSAYAP